MKDTEKSIYSDHKAKQLKKAATKNSKKMPSLVSGINLGQSSNSVESLELLCNSHSALLSDQKSRLLSLEVYIDNYKQEFNDQRKRIQDLECYLSRTNVDFISEDVSQLKEVVEISTRRCDDMIGELSKAQSSHHSLINQRIDRLYHELQVLNDSYKLNHLCIKQAVDSLGNTVHELNDARGLDLDMKKIVDGLEETVHGLESKLGLRCDLHERTVARFKERTECDIFNHIFVFRNEMEEIKKTRKLTEWLVVWGFTMALVAFASTIINIIKQMFF